MTTNLPVWLRPHSVNGEIIYQGALACVIWTTTESSRPLMNQVKIFIITCLCTKEDWGYYYNYEGEKKQKEEKPATHSHKNISHSLW